MAGENNYQDLPESQIAEMAINEIKRFGDDINGVKKQQDEINKNYKNLIDSFEAEKQDKTKIEKLKTDIIARQDEIDKKHNDQIKRLDEIELALKRPGLKNGNIDEKLEKEIREHVINCKTVQGNGKGLKYYELDDLKPTIDDYRAYQKAFNEILRKDEKYIEPSFFKTLSVGVDPHGGYTVTPFMATQVLGRLYEIDPIRQLAQTMTISTDAVEWMVDRDEATVGWVGETTAPTETGTPDLGRKRIAVHELFAEPRATQQLLEDSAINIESWLANKIADRMGRVEAAAFVSGDGIGKPRGFLTYTSGTTWGTIEQVNMGAAATLTADGFVSIKYSLIEQYLNSGTWLMNRLTVRDAMLLKNGAGDYIWKPSMIASDPSSLILGLPVRMSTTMPTVAANALSVVLADFREAYMIVDRLGITIIRDNLTAKPFVKFYTRKRVGGDVTNYDAIKIGVIAV